MSTTERSPPVKTRNLPGTPLMQPRSARASAGTVGAPAATALLAVLAAAPLGALLAGCGFHLEGHTPLPAVVRSPYVEAPERQSDFVQSLRHELTSNGARLTPDRSKASAVVSIVRDDVVRRVLSVSALNQPNEYEVTYTVGFSVTAGDKELLPAQEVSVIRTYSFDERLLLAKGHEEDILRRDMARDLAERVMRRLSSL
jgi:LPS-assembly lipoprotein